MSVAVGEVHLDLAGMSVYMDTRHNLLVSLFGDLSKSVSIWALTWRKIYSSR